MTAGLAAAAKSPKCSGGDVWAQEPVNLHPILFVAGLAILDKAGQAETIVTILMRSVRYKAPKESITQAKMKPGIGQLTVKGAYFAQSPLRKFETTLGSRQRVGYGHINILPAAQTRWESDFADSSLLT